MAKSKDTTPRTTRTRVTVDLDPDDAKRLAEARERSVLPVSQSSVVRVAIRRGLDSLLRDGIAVAPKVTL